MYEDSHLGPPLGLIERQLYMLAEDLGLQFAYTNHLGEPNTVTYDEMAELTRHVATVLCGTDGEA